MMTTVPHVTSGLGLRKFQADGFLLTRVYVFMHAYLHEGTHVCMYITMHVCVCVCVRAFVPPGDSPFAVKYILLLLLYQWSILTRRPGHAEGY